MTNKNHGGYRAFRALTGGLSKVSRVAAQGLCALLAVWVLSGCSTLQVAYTFAEESLESRADDYLDLSPEQEVQLESQASALIAWHRREMLPKYAAFLTAQADIAEAGGWTREQFSQAFAGFRALVDETVAGASPFVATVLTGHTTPGKVLYIKERIAERNAERRTEQAERTPEEAIEDWVEGRVERISRFTGTLNDDQVAIIRKYADRGMAQVERWRANRTKRQEAFIAFLHASPSEDAIAHFVHRILLHAHEIVDPDYRATSEARWTMSEALYFDVLKSLSDEQRRELISTLRGYAADMVDLAEV